MSIWRKLFSSTGGLESELCESISQYSEQEKQNIIKLYHARMGILTKVNSNINPMVLSSSIPLIKAAAKHGFQFEKMLGFWFNLAEKDIDPYYAFDNTIPAIADRFENPQEFELLLYAVERLVDALSELVTRRGAEIAARHAAGQLSLNKANLETVNAKVILSRIHSLGVVTTLIRTNDAYETIREFIEYAVRLANYGIDPTDALSNIPRAIQGARSADEAETMMILLDRFVRRSNALVAQNKDDQAFADLRLYLRLVPNTSYRAQVEQRLRELRG